MGTAHVSTRFRRELGRRPLVFAIVVACGLLMLLSSVSKTARVGAGSVADRAGGEALFGEELFGRVTNLEPGASLYRLGPPAAPICPKLDRHQGHAATAGAEALLTPPRGGTVGVWDAPTGAALEEMHRKRAARLLRPWLKTGVLRSHMVVADHTEHVTCEEPIMIKYAGGRVYASIPTAHVGNLAGFNPDKSAFMNMRRRHTLEAVNQAVKNNLAKGRVMKDFQIMGCVGDGYFPDPSKVALGLSWGGEGTGTLPMSEMEWNWPGYARWGSELEKTFQNRHAQTWEQREPRAIWRGGVIDRQCFPMQDVGGDEMGAEDSSFAGSTCGRHRLLQMAQCFPEQMDVKVSDHGANWITPAQQEAFKYVIYVEGNYGWANRLKTLLAMGSAILFQKNSGGSEWYALDLVPWVHYIPVDHLFNHLPEAMAWGYQNDDAVKQISANADAYAKALLSPDSFAQHLEVMLSEYSKLIRFPVDIDPTLDISAEFFADAGWNKHAEYLKVVRQTVVEFSDQNHIKGF